MLDGYIKYNTYQNSELEITNVIENQSLNSRFLPVRKAPRTYRSLMVKSQEPGVNLIHFESKVEYEAFLLLKFDNDIDYIVEQPIKIEFVSKDGKNSSLHSGFFGSF